MAKRNPFFHGVGGVLSADIAVPNHEREVAFFARVLTTGASPLWRDDLMNNRGEPIIGLGERVPAYESLPLQWMPHIQVADVAACCAKAVELGGAEVMHGRDDAGQCQWAVLVDPAGAAFGVMPVVPDESNGERVVETVGRIAGLSLEVADVTSMSAFYEQVVGWTASPADSQGAIEMLRADGAVEAVIRPVKHDETPVPSVWMLHLPVGDLAASLVQVREGGGEVLREDAAGGFAVIRDPVGVCIALRAEA